MRRGWKIFWIVCGICMGIGLVCCAVSFVMGVTVDAIENRFPDGIGIVRKASENDYYDGYDFDEDGYDFNDPDDDIDSDDLDDPDDDDDYDSDDDYNWHHEEGTQDTHHASGGAEGTVTNMGSETKVISGSESLSFTGVNELDVYEWGGILQVDTAAASSDEITVEIENVSNRLGLRCYMDGNELKIVTKKKVVGINSKKIGTVTLHVPQNYRFREASLELVGGYIHIQDICADELSVDVGAGEGVVENFNAIEADLKCGAGSLMVSGNADTQTEIDCGVGEVVFTAAGKQSDYNYEFDCGMGQIVCGEGRYLGVGMDETVDNHAAKNIEISCGMGSVTVNFAGM